MYFNFDERNAHQSAVTIGIIIGSFCIVIEACSLQGSEVFLFILCLNIVYPTIAVFPFVTIMTLVIIVKGNVLDSLGCERKLSPQNFLRYSEVAGESALAKFTVYEV